MTTEGPNTERLSSEDLVRSLSSSAEVWNEVLQRLNEAEGSKARLSQAVDHLGVVGSTPLVAAPELAGRGAIAPHLFGGDVPTPAPPLREHQEVEAEEAGEQMSGPAAMAVAEAPLAVEEPDSDTALAYEGTIEGEESWLIESVVVLPADPIKEAREQPWLDVPAPGTAAEIAPDIVPEAPREVVAETARDTEIVSEAPGEAAAEAPPEAVAEATPETAADVPPEILTEAPPEGGTESPPGAAAETPPEVLGDESQHEQPWIVEPVATTTAERELEGRRDLVRAHEAEHGEALVAQADSRAAALVVPGESHDLEGALSGIRVLTPERVAEMSPAVVDALLAAEFGEAAARLMDPETLTLDALLSEEFGPLEEEEKTRLPRSAVTILDSPPAERTLPPPPSRPLPPPPPPSSLLPPPPRSAVTEAPRPVPLSEGVDSPEATPGPRSMKPRSLKPSAYVGKSPPPIPVDLPPSPPQELNPTAPPAGAAGADTKADVVPETSESTPPFGTPSVAVQEAGAAESISDLPPLSFDTPLFTGEPTLSAEAPPIPEAVATPHIADPEGTLTDSGVSVEANSFGVASDLPPLSFDTPLFTGEPNLSAEAPPIPEGAPVPRAEPPSASGTPPQWSLVTEVFSATPEPPDAHGYSAKMDAPPPEGQAESNLVSQDFTIISKKRKRFRLR